jgi:hypothetical protein
MRIVLIWHESLQSRSIVLSLQEILTMAKEQKSVKETKKKPLLTPKEKKAAKKEKQNNKS